MKQTTPKFGDEDPAASEIMAEFFIVEILHRSLYLRMTRS